MDRPATRFSVIVASRGRPGALRRCLSAVSQLMWSDFEVIVVTDQAGNSAVANLPQAAGFRVVSCEIPNVAHSRNLGVARSGGDVLAFIDDDAVPEPMWLAALADAFRDPAIGAATGPVIGRNGISLQSGPEIILPNGESLPHGLQDGRILPGAGRAAKTQGTNMAMRADLLRALGGFDPAFAFCFDDSDLNMRAAKANTITAYHPLAVVHHDRQPSERRRPDRVPTDHFDLGRSLAAFLARHLEPPRHPRAIAAWRAAELRRAVQHLQSGAIEPRDISRLMASFDAGVRAGQELGRPEPVGFPAPPGFKSVGRPAPRRHTTIVSGLAGSADARLAASEAVSGGEIVSLLILSRTALYHRSRFRDGIWLQTGGTFGRAERSEPVFRASGLRRRAEQELERIGPVRGFSPGCARLLPPDLSVELRQLSFI